MDCSFSSNFGIMDNLFLSLNDDIGNMEENIFYPGDSWQGPKSKTNKMLSQFEGNFKEKEVNDSPKKREYNDHLRYLDIFDSDDETFQRDFFDGLKRPKSSGTIPKSRRFLSTNMSDPCLLSSTREDMLKNPSPENPSAGAHSTNKSELNSLDSGILDEGFSGASQVGE